MDTSKKKPRNMTSDGRRCIRVDAGTDPVTGKRVRKAFYGKTLKEARQKADAYRQAVAAGVAVEAQNQTLGQWIDAWLATYGGQAGYSRNRTQELDAQRLSARLGGMKLTEIRQVHIQQYADAMSDYAKSTVSKIKMTTNAIFRAAMANRLILFDPCVGVRWQNVGEGTHRRLEDWEVHFIVDHWQAHRAGLWALIMLFAGLRRGEVLALTWGDIDFDSNLIHVRHGVHFEVNAPILDAPKTPCSIRDVPIVPPLRRALEAARGRNDELICIGAAGQPVTGSIWASSWRAWLSAMSNILNGDTRLPVAPGRRSDKDPEGRRRFDIRAHDLRHTFASMLYDAGVDVKTAQRLLGHASPEITLRLYTHLSEQRKQSGIECIMAYTQSNF